MKPPNPIREELDAHIARRAADLEAQGMDRDAAMRQAREEFGIVDTYEAQCRREQRLGIVNRIAGDVSRDIVYAWRRLRATPLFTIFAVVSLAVGIGVTTAIFSVVDSLFFLTPGIPQPDRAAVIAGSSAYSGGSRSWVGIASKADFDDVAGVITSFDRRAASLQFWQALVTAQQADTIGGEAVTGEYFQAIGVSAARGRVLDASDDATGRAVVVLSHRFWQSRFESDPGAIGQIVRIGGHPFEIVGVASAPYDGLSLAMPRHTSAWIPLRTAALFPNAASADRRPPREQRRLSIVGRLAPGATAPRASAEVSALSQRLDEAYPISAAKFDGTSVPVARRWHVRTVAAAHEDMAADPRRFGLILVILVALVLIVACTNLANLTLARGTSRHHEHAVRRALGASRWRLVREQCAESAILAVLGGIAAFAVIRVLLFLFTAEIPLSAAFVVQLQPELSARSLVLAVAALALSLVVFGLAPALQLTRSSVRGDLAQSAASVVPATTPARRRSVRWQVTIAVSFFLVSTMALRAVMVEARHDSGIDLDRLAVAFIDFRLQRWDETRARPVLAALERELGGQTELESGALSSGMPFGTTTTPFLDMGRPGTVFVKNGRYPEALALVSTPGIFRTLGVPILRGRGFDERDGAGRPRVVVMNELAARELFQTTDVVGRELAYRMNAGRSSNQDTVTARVIGVAGDTDAQFLTRRNSGAVYIPLAQQYEPTLAVVGRAKSDTRKATDALRAAVRAADPEVSVNRAGPASMLLAGFYFTARIAATTAAALGLLALTLSMVGLHGILAQMVTMRTREVGLRIALGAERRQISRMVLGDGFKPVIQGLALGLLLGVLGRFVVRATVAPAVVIFDPLALAVIPIPILAAGWLACYWPARRASHVDPNVALRAL